MNQRIIQIDYDKKTFSEYADRVVNNENALKRFIIKTTKDIDTNKEKIKALETNARFDRKDSFKSLIIGFVIGIITPIFLDFTFKNYMNLLIEVPILLIIIIVLYIKYTDILPLGKTTRYVVNDEDKKDKLNYCVINLKTGRRVETPYNIKSLLKEINYEK